MSNVLEVIDHARKAVEAGQDGEAYLALKSAMKMLEAAEHQLAAPVQFLFGLGDPFGGGDIYAYIVEENFYQHEGCLDDSSSASSTRDVIRQKYEKLEAETEAEDAEDLPTEDDMLDEVNLWLTKATEGILFGEDMESCWNSGWLSQSNRKLHEERPEVFGKLNDPYEGKTREQAIEIIKAALIERGFKHEPKLDGDW